MFQHLESCRPTPTRRLLGSLRPCHRVWAHCSPNQPSTFVPTLRELASNHQHQHLESCESTFLPILKLECLQRRARRQRRASVADWLLPRKGSRVRAERRGEAEGSGKRSCPNLGSHAASAAAAGPRSAAAARLAPSRAVSRATAAPPISAREARHVRPTAAWAADATPPPSRRSQAGLPMRRAACVLTSRPAETREVYTPAHRKRRTLAGPSTEARSSLLARRSR
mmetsp:Transcript_42288/g.137265  ORF Transcript_42288/g.137265 Transcript_42288/m.137265 type:complete len:226 (+) Transcript_42288:975-1652(+)